MEQSPFSSIPDQPKKTVGQRRGPLVVAMSKRTLWSKLSKNWSMGTVIQHLLFLGGMAGVSYSAWMVYRPLGVAVGSLGAMTVSYLMMPEEKTKK